MGFLAVPSMKLDQILDSRGRALPEDLQNDLKTAILRTIQHPDSNIEAVVQRARAIAGKALDGEIRDVLRYATKSLFAVSRKKQRSFEKETAYCREPQDMTELAGAAVDGSPDAIEARILAQEILNALPKTEREVLLRYTMGWKHSMIAKELGISAAMSSYYLLRAQARLHKIFHEDVGHGR